MREKPSAPLFSIITATFNAADLLPPTINSLECQSCRLFEWIVVDGASTDGTVALARGAAVDDIDLTSEPDRGIYDAMNKGLARARGEYVIFLNAGDALHSTSTLQLLADAIMDNDFPGVVYGQTDIVGSDRHRLADRHLRAPATLSLADFRDGMLVCHQSFVALRRITGPFDTRYRFSADYDWTIRCLQHSRRNVYVDAVVADYLFEGATTRNRRSSLKERFKIMAYYYGFFPTVWRHLKFIPRYLRRRRLEKSFTSPS